MVQDPQGLEMEDGMHQSELEVGNPAGQLQRPLGPQGNKYCQLEGDTPWGLLSNLPRVTLGSAVGAP